MSRRMGTAQRQLHAAAVDSTSRGPAAGATRAAVAPVAWHETGPSPALLRRREQASRVRARRLFVADVLAGALLALFGILLAPGLAIVALVALPVLCGCLIWHVRERWRGR